MEDSISLSRSLSLDIVLKMTSNLYKSCQNVFYLTPLDLLFYNCEFRFMNEMVE